MLILASSSPRRHELLAAAGYRFEVMPAGIEEVLPGHLSVREAVLLNAMRKGAAVATRHPEACVVSADTLVALDGRPLGKPAGLADAARMLRSLGGRTHQVFSGVVVERRAAGWIKAFVEVSHVRFRELSDEEIARYLALVHVLDKAGAYAAQEDPIGIIQSIEGLRSNVIGLPIERLAPLLEGM